LLDAVDCRDVLERFGYDRIRPPSSNSSILHRAFAWRAVHFWPARTRLISSPLNEGISMVNQVGAPASPDEGFVEVVA